MAETRAQDAKVEELLAQGYVRDGPPAGPAPVGGPVRMRAPDGARVTVTGDGAVVPDAPAS